jgi:hypothetical protein
VSGIAYPGRGDVEPGGFTTRPDGLQVVTTKYTRHGYAPIWTTAIYPRDTGRVVVLTPSAAEFEFAQLPEAAPLWVAWAPRGFEAGRHHELALDVEFASPKKGVNAWTRLIQDMLDIP